jgi:hypothetical protein
MAVSQPPVTERGDPRVAGFIRQNERRPAVRVTCDMRIHLLRLAYVSICSIELQLSL